MKFFNSILERMNVLHILIISYLLVLILPVFLGIFIFFEYDRVLNDEIINLNKSVLTQVVSRIDNSVSGIMSMGRQLENNRYLKSIAQLDKDITVEENAALTEFVQQEYSNYSIGLEVLNSYIYLKKSGRMLQTGAVSDGIIAYEIANEIFPLDKDSWVSLMGEDYYFDFIANAQNDCVLCLHTVFRDTEYEATFVVPITGKQMVETIYDTGFVEKSGAFAIFSQKGEMLFATREDFPKYDNDKDFCVVQTAHGSAAVSQMQSSVTGWKCVTAQPLDTFFASKERTKLISIAALILFIIIGIGASMFFSSYNYKPIKEIMHVFGVKSTGKEYRRFIQTLNIPANRHKESMKQVMLHRMLSGVEGTDMANGSLLEEYGIEKVRNVAAIVICIDRLADFFEEYRKPDDESLIMYAISNVMSEMLQGRGISVYLTNYGGNMAGIINSADSCDSVKETLSEVTEVLKEQVGIEASISAGGFYSDAADISKSRSEAETAMEYMRFAGLRGAIEISELEGLENECIFTDKMRSDLTNAILAGSSDRAAELIDSYFDFEIRYTVGAIEKFMNEIIGVIISIVNEAEQKWMLYDKSMQQLLGAEAIPDFMHHATQLLKMVCGEITRVERKSGDKLVGQVVEYVEAHYSDPELSIVSIAEALNMNSNYLSHYFKEKSGDGISGFIAQKRLDASRRLLITTNYTIAEIAGMCGYNNSLGLIRLYKRFYKMTPTQFREINNS